MGAIAALTAALPPAVGHAGQCPRRFDEATTGLPEACVFIGSYNTSCGEEAVALFAGDGSALVVSLSPSATAPPLFIPAQTLSPTEAKLVLWRPDLELDEAPSVGVVRLADDGGRLVLRMKTPVTSPGGCPLQEFVGRFAGMVAAADDPGGERRQARIATIQPARLAP